MNPLTIIRLHVFINMLLCKIQVSIAIYFSPSELCACFLKSCIRFVIEILPFFFFVNCNNNEEKHLVRVKFLLTSE